ncbi:hypothetical protein [Streptomyces sp. NPDC056160]|uniref:hypothetical protein n=1 Tax=Streptomyces sp. NPDC056160 TaxID=3345731 RepID=UPI0035DC5061
MQKAFWSRRRGLGALAAATAVAATSSVLWPATATAAETAGTGPVPLPETERARAVRAWPTGGKGVKAATITALYGTDTGIRGAADKALGGGLVEPVVDKITDTGTDLVSGITKGLSDIWGLTA